MTTRRRNLSTTLRRRPRAAPMAAYDTLPAPLRAWLAVAALPWSVVSARRLWQRALSEGGSTDAARARLDAVEAALIARDAARIWGPDHPAARPADR